LETSFAPCDPYQEQDRTTGFRPARFWTGEWPRSGPVLACARSV